MDSISSILYAPTEKFKVQLSVGLIDKLNKRPAISVYDRDDGKSYMTVNPVMSVILKYCDKDRPWDLKDQVYITQNNLYTLRLQVESFCKKYYRDDMYSYNDNGDPTSINDNEDDYEIVNLGKGQFLKLEPAIVFDDKESPYPGVIMKINSESREIPLFIDQFEGFVDLVQHLNIRQEGFNLIQLYLIMDKTNSKNTITPNNSYKAPSRFNVFDKVGVESKTMEMVKSPPRIDKGPKNLDDV